MEANEVKGEFGLLLDMWERDWATDTTSTMQKEPADIEIGTKELYPAAEQTIFNTVVVATRSSTGRDPRDIGEYPFAKCYWHQLSGWTLGLCAFDPLVLEATEDQLGYPEDLVASTSPWPPLWEPAEPERTAWRGVFSPTYSRKVLFSKELGIVTAELPRWKPHITIDRRTLEKEDG